MAFGDLDDPRTLVARLARSPRAFRLLEDLGTEPKVIYLSKGNGVLDLERHDDEPLLAPMMHSGRGFWLLAGAPGPRLAGLAAWLVQLRRGLAVTGLNVPVYWGLYITHFVFFIGISHAGTLISAILRLSGAEWRRPSRAAEVITVLVLFFGWAASSSTSAGPTARCSCCATRTSAPRCSGT
jgi:hypothetical protein